MENNFKLYRIQKGISVIDISKMLNVSRQTYTNYENGSYEPTLSTLLKISKILDVSIDTLLNNEVAQKKEEEQKRFYNEVANLVEKFK